MGQFDYILGKYINHSHGTEAALSQTQSQIEQLYQWLGISPNYLTDKFIIRFSYSNNGSPSKFIVSITENVTVEILGNGMLYDDENCTTGWSKTKTLNGGENREIHFRITGAGALTISNKNVITMIRILEKFKAFASFNIDVLPQLTWLEVGPYFGYSVNINGTPPYTLDVLYLLNNDVSWTYAGSMPNLSFILISSNNVNLTMDGIISDKLSFIHLIGSNINWTNISFSGTTNIICLNLYQYTAYPLNDTQLINILTSLTNYQGLLQSGIVIGEYQNATQPPIEVIQAINTLRTTKNVSTVELLGINSITFTSENTGAPSKITMSFSQPTKLHWASSGAYFYDDEACTQNPTNFKIFSGNDVPIYFKCTGSNTLMISDSWAVKKFDCYTGFNGYFTLNLNIFVGCEYFRISTITGRANLSGALTDNISIFWLDSNNIYWTYNGAPPSGVIMWYLIGNNIYWTYNGSIPSGVTYLRLIGNNIYWTYNGAPPSGVTHWYLSGNNIYWTYNGAPPSGVTHWYLSGNNIYWTYNGNLPNSLTFIYLQGNSIYFESSQNHPNIYYYCLNGSNINYLVNNFAGSGNIGENSFILPNWRISKIDDNEMITILTSLKNRVGSLPSSIIIGDYLNYANPPQSVVDAIQALKTAKNITTVTLLG